MFLMTAFLFPFNSMLLGNLCQNFLFMIYPLIVRFIIMFITPLLLLLSKVTQKHFRQPYPSIKSTLAPCRELLFRYSCLHIFQISTIRCSHQIPFSCRIHLHSCPYPLINNQNFQTFSAVKSCINP